MTKTLRIGSGAAWWGDRVEPAALNAERGELDYLCFETMAEATVSAAQVRMRRDPGFPGYDTYLDDRMRAVLPALVNGGNKMAASRHLRLVSAADDRGVIEARWMDPCDADPFYCGVAAGSYSAMSPHTTIAFLPRPSVAR